MSGVRMKKGEGGPVRGGELETGHYCRGQGERNGLCHRYNEDLKEGKDSPVRRSLN